jgi:MFS family permease
MTPRERRQAQIAITLCASVYGFTIGLVAPLIAVFLEQRGFNASFIGLNAAMTAFGMIAVTPILPRLAASLGIKRVILGCLLVDALCLLSFPFVEAVWLWFVLRFFIGAANNVVFIAAETWINEIAEDAHRGRMLAVFNAVLVLALSLGPLVMPLTGGAGPGAFVVGAFVIACAALPLAFTGRTEPTLHGSASFNILSFIWMAPVVSCAVLLYSWRETGIASFLPVYSLHNGLPLHAAAINLTTMGLGGVTLAYAFGWMADRFERFRLLGLCGAGIGLCALVLPLVIHHALWRSLLLFCWGGLFTGLYTVTLALVGERYKGMELAVANIAIGLLWGLGALSGSSLTGAALSWWDPQGFPLLYTLAGFAFAGFVGWRSLTLRTR